MKKKFKIWSISGLTAIGGFVLVWLNVYQKTVEIASASPQREKRVFEKPESELDNYIPYELKTLHGIKAEASE